MKKLLILLGIILVGGTLSACEDNTVTITPPTLVSFQVEGANPKDSDGFVKHYRGKDETVEVSVVLENPSNVPITSILVNGRNYRANIYKEGSTPTSIAFDLNVGSTTGETIFSVDQVKYSNGETTEKVDVTIPNEFLVYVYKDIPIVERQDYVLGQNSISVDISLDDEDDVILPNTLIAELFIGESLEDTIVLQPGQTNITFDGLYTNRTYDVKLKANFNLDDGDGDQIDKTLYHDQFTTLPKTTPTAQINNIVVTNNIVEFDVLFNDKDGVVIENGLRVVLFSDGACVKDEFDACIAIPLTGSAVDLSFADLLNSHEYQLKVIADIDLQDGQGVFPDNELVVGGFNTSARIEPIAFLENLNIEENRVYFDVEIDDPNGLLTADSLYATVYVRDTEIKRTKVINNSVDFQIVNLFANHEFTILITGEYDLNDGDGLLDNRELFNQTYTTLINDEPVIRVQEILVRQGYIELAMQISDPYQTLRGDITATLFENGVPVVVIDDVEVTDISLLFKYLVTYTEVYTIELTADYNLRDDEGTQFGVKLFSSIIVSVEKKAPAAEIEEEGLVLTNESIGFTVDIMDADNAIGDGNMIAYLYLGNTIVQQADINKGDTYVQFDNLLSNTDYRVLVKADYDLDDGTGVQLNQKLLEESVSTTEKSLPEAEFLDFEVTTESLSVPIVIDDPDGVIVEDSIKALLYKNGVPTGDEFTMVNGANPAVLFTDLLSANVYQVVVVISYDLNDGNPAVENVILATSSTSTQAKVEPNASIDIIDETKTEIIVDIDVTDDDLVITGDEIYAAIYVNDVMQGSPQQLNPGLNPNVTFSIYSSTRAVIKVYATYDLNDGNPAFVERVLVESSVRTLEKLPPEAEISNVVLGKKTIQFDVFVTDDDGAIEDGTLVVELYKDGGVVSSQSLSVGNNTRIFTGLNADAEYQIRVKADYTLRGPEQIVTDVVFDSYIAITEPLDIPSATITINEIENTKFTFDVLVLDLDGTIDNLASLKAILYDGDTAIDEIDLSVSNNTNLSFEDLEFYKEYTITVVTDYSLNEGNDHVVGAVLATKDEMTKGVIIIDNFTEVKLDPTSIPVAFDPSELFIRMDVTINDELNVLDDVPLMFQLYKADDTPVGNALFIYTDTNLELINLLFGNEYYYEITAEYTIDGTPGTSVVYRDSFETTALALSDMFVTNLVVTDTSISFDVDNVVDTDGIIVSDFRVVLVTIDEFGNETTMDETLAVGDNAISFAVDGTLDVSYTIQIIATVNFRDGVGDIADYTIYSKTFLYSD